MLSSVYATVERPSVRQSLSICLSHCKSRGAAYDAVSTVPSLQPRDLAELRLAFCVFAFYSSFVDKTPENVTAAADVTEYEDDFEESEKSSVAASSDEGDCSSSL